MHLLVFSKDVLQLLWSETTSDIFMDSFIQFVQRKWNKEDDPRMQFRNKEHRIYGVGGKGRNGLQC